MTCGCHYIGAVCDCHRIDVICCYRRLSATSGCHCLDTMCIYYYPLEVTCGCRYRGTTFTYVKMIKTSKIYSISYQINYR